MPCQQKLNNPSINLGVFVYNQRMRAKDSFAIVKKTLSIYNAITQRYAIYIRKNKT